MNSKRGDFPSIAELLVACADLWQSIEECRQQIEDAKKCLQKISAHAEYLFSAFDHPKRREPE